MKKKKLPIAFTKAKLDSLLTNRKFMKKLSLKGDLILLNNHILAHGRTTFKIGKSQTRESFIEYGSTKKLFYYPIISWLRFKNGKFIQKYSKVTLKVGSTTPLDSLVKKLRFRGVKEINMILGFKYKKF